MRLQLAGALVFNGTCWVVPWRARDFVHYWRRRQVGRPQLKRDPLGSGITIDIATL